VYTNVRWQATGVCNNWCTAGSDHCFLQLATAPGCADSCMQGVQQQQRSTRTSTLLLPNLPSNSLLALRAALPRSESAFLTSRMAAQQQHRRQVRHSDW
jgi:hypothetical protein